MATKKKANNLKDQSQWEYKEEIVATYGSVNNFVYPSAVIKN